jgi:glycosyltransferase involved in cell wall biosynthesis
MLAYLFPPHGGGGVQRTLKYVKYLPGEGFDPIVVTASARGFPLRDAALPGDVPESTVVLRAPSIPIQDLRWKSEAVLRKLGLSPWPASLIGWPDEMAGWLPGAVLCALRAVRRHRPETLYTTSAPMTAHLAGLVIQRLTGLPWVADFRDPWTLHPNAERQVAPMARATEGLERTVTRRAARTIVADESMRLVGLAPGDRRLAVIRNGVDPDDLAKAARSPVPRHFRLAYVGSLYGQRNARPVFAALRAALDRGVFDPGAFELRLVGDVHIAPDPDLAALPTTRIGYVNHLQALSEMAAASALLFYLPPGLRLASGKIYEYLVSGRPVLCVAPRDNLAYHLVEELGAGACAEPHDADGIRQAIETLAAHWRSGTLALDATVGQETLRRFSRRALAAQLAGVLRSAEAEGAGGPTRAASPPVANAPARSDQSTW